MDLSRNSKMIIIAVVVILILGTLGGVGYWNRDWIKSKFSKDSGAAPAAATTPPATTPAATTPAASTPAAATPAAATAK